MKNEVEEAIKKLIEKAVTTSLSIEAMQHTQAVLNLAYVLATLDNMKTK